jgi:glycosyltransferase involved in cell wall biosynthesis
MKILWFTNTPCSAAEKLFPSLKGGGWLTSLEREISSIPGIELHIAFYHSKKIKEFVHNNTHFHPVYRKLTGTKFERFLTRVFRLENNDKSEIGDMIKTIELIQPDLIHIHGTEENFGLIQDLIKIPVVISIQGLLSSIVEKYFTGIPSFIATRYSTIKDKFFFRTPKYNFKLLNRKAIRERQILSTCRFILGRTDFDQRVTQVLAPKSKYFVCNEILRSSFYCEQWNKSGFNEKICIVSVISDSNYKGFETILKTSDILSAYPNLNFEWLVAGISAQSNIFRIAKKWIKTKSGTKYIKLLGVLNEHQIVDLLKSSDMFCQVSHIENSPNSLCEAMLLGVPSIASNAGGTSSMLDNGKEGILVQDGDPYVLAGAILEISKDFSRATGYGQNARTRSIDRHDKNKIINNLIKIYISVLNEN